MHSRPSSNLPLLPLAFTKLITTRVLKPTDPTTSHITLEHERTVGVADDEIHEAVLGDVACYDGDRAVELADEMLGPCWTLSTEIEVRRWEGTYAGSPRGYDTRWYQLSQKRRGRRWGYR